MIFRKSYLVYHHVSKAGAETWFDDDVAVEPATKNSVYGFFGDDRKRHDVFMEYVRKKYVGLILHNNSEWLAYAWMSNPLSEGPPHLAPSLKSLCPYWIFYCHTKQRFRGRGFYKLSLRQMLKRAREHMDELKRRLPVYIDTERSNVASRRGIISAGFKEKGVVVCYYLRIPGHKVILKQKWLWDRSHPVLGRAKVGFKDSRAGA